MPNPQRFFPTYAAIATELLCSSVLALAVAAEEFTPQAAQEIERKAWLSLPQILERIIPPSFPATQFNIVDHGAASDGKTDARAAIQKAIDACHTAGGGRVVVPTGEFFSDGPLRLKSNVDLHIAEGATLRFGSNPDRYLPLVKVRWEGTVGWNWSPLIYAYQQENIAITGLGTIDGDGVSWSKTWRKLQEPEKATLRKMGNDKVPDDERVFGNGFLDLDGDGKDDGFGDGQVHTLRPGLIALYECKNILVEDATLQEAPCWTLHFAFCKNVTARRLKVHGEFLNDDGIDPDSCEDVLIENCHIDTVDDAIAIKAGRDQDAWDRPPCRNIIVRNCRLISHHNTLAIGSEMSGGVENVFVENCHLSGKEHGLIFKANLDRGGRVQGVYMRDLQIDSAEAHMLYFCTDYHGYRGNNHPPRFQDFYVANLHGNTISGSCFNIVGLKQKPISRVSLRDITVENAATPGKIEHTQNIVTQGITINGQPWQPE